MTCKHCPTRKHCFDKGSCETCEFGKKFEALHKKITRLKKKNKTLEEENEKLKKRIDILECPDF